MLRIDSIEFLQPVEFNVSVLSTPFQSILADVKLPTPVEILLLQSVPPRWIKATLLPLQEDQGDLLTLQLQKEEDPIILPFGAKVILHFSNDDGPMLSLGYYDQEEGSITLQFSQVHQRDKRSFPRHYGNIPLSFRPIPEMEEELSVKQWLKNHTDVDSRWLTPEPFMNFSLGGLSFESPTPLDYQTLVLLNMGIGQSEERWRGTARVVRCIEINATTYDIAISFEEIPDGAIEALSELTLSVQEALL